MKGISLLTLTVVTTVALFLDTWLSLATATANKISRSKRSAKIAGGSLASITDFPFAVQLRIFDGFATYQCAGSIIRSNIVLTAAHCVEGLSENLGTRTRSHSPSITVLGGETRRHGNGPHSQRRDVLKFRRHPKYDESTVENDVAVLLLAKPFDFEGSNAHVGQVSLPVGDRQSFSGKAQACGWGRLGLRDVGGYDGGSNRYLQKATIPLVNNSVCESYYTGHQHEFKSSVMLCAGGGLEDTCSGDSGGPLICQDHYQPYLCGITSWGNGCRWGIAPGVYVRVSVFVPWIRSQIQELTATDRQGGSPQPQPQPHRPKPQTPMNSPKPNSSSSSYQLPAQHYYPDAWHSYPPPSYGQYPRWVPGYDYDYLTASSNFYLRPPMGYGYGYRHDSHRFG